MAKRSRRRHENADRAFERLEREKLALTKDYRDVLSQAHAREVLLRAEVLRLKHLGKQTKVTLDPILELAATNVFVEKAQYHLTRRAWVYVGVATLLAFCVLGLIYFAFRYLSAQILPKLPQGMLASEITWPITIIWTLQAATIAGMIFAGVYFLASLCRAFLHEATALFSKRHALRFGRLLVYLKFAGISKPSELRKLKESLNPVEFGQAFGWNIEASSAFKDINPADMSRNLLSRILDYPEKIIRSTGQALSKSKESMR